MAAKDLSGLVFGEWYVLNRIHINPLRVTWLCKCSCGAQCPVDASHLKAGRSTKCKTCHNKQAVLKRPKKHGHSSHRSNSREYRIWRCMKYRCESKNSDSYMHYGAKGIKVCKEWSSSFKSFLGDMGLCPPNHSIDRIDNGKGYFKDNCRWSSVREQNRNKKGVILLLYGKEMLCASEVARELRIPYTTFFRRLKKEGWPFKVSELEGN